MIRLTLPKYTFESTLDKCILGITGNNNLKTKVTASKQNLVQAESKYIKASSAGTLTRIQAIDTSQNADPTVVFDLKKSELKKIYETYFRPDEKPGREIYDHILNSANESCPYCGGIGTPKNLDHYLPVAHFPQYSVMPRNLVPTCRDCNMDGIPDGYATKPEDQIIQPYLDQDIFFNDQWISATYQPGNNTQPGAIQYFTMPPNYWSAVNKLRVEKHFNDFELSRRYSTKAAELLGTTLSQITLMRRSGLNDASIIHVLLQPGVDNAPFLNHWQNGMYQAFIASLPHIT